MERKKAKRVTPELLELVERGLSESGPQSIFLRVPLRSIAPDLCHEIRRCWIEIETLKRQVRRGGKG